MCVLPWKLQNLAAARLAGAQFVQVIGPPLQQPAALGQMYGVQVGGEHAVAFAVAELPVLLVRDFDPLKVPRKYQQFDGIWQDSAGTGWNQKTRKPLSGVGFMDWFGLEKTEKWCLGPGSNRHDR